MRKAAAVNSKNGFRYVFEKAFEELLIDRLEGNEEIFGKLMADSEFRKLVGRAPPPQTLWSFEEHSKRTRPSTQICNTK